MARRRRQSGADDILDLVAMLPWWAGVALAIISYLILHQLAATPKVTAVQPGQLGGMVTGMMLAAFASIGQYLLPFFCLLGALTSFLRRRKREGLLNEVTSAKGADALHGMSWREFEMLVGEAFRLQGYAVTELGGAGADGGVDLVLRKGNEKFLVQCKQWKATKVPVQIIRELYGVMAAQGADGGFVITAGSFTADAKAFAEGRNVQLVDGPQLFELLRQGKTGAKARAANTAAVGLAAPSPPPASEVAPSCPLCESTMVRRTARKGVNAGSSFWGCPKFPVCRGTR
ncbi:restriction endonuclease [Ramlibacter sp. WS9]|uniref:restriction endonuclease n=1 Tax=Ramlibacter sp. WS9 TaxID=1882741 RepID=UPI001143A99A|nr:restriction endonuclease [Ramlibacter sp. WS9]ROZ71477.1 restriction endonuclease [Ramlibacter sp. WS9]